MSKVSKIQRDLKFFFRYILNFKMGKSERKSKWKRKFRAIKRDKNKKKS